MRTNLDKRIAVASFGIACTIGLVGAFVGLDVSSFGMDELNTAWVFEAGIGFREFLARFLTDLHPPVYYVLAFLHVRLFGDDEVALRGLSAALGVAALLLFCTATRFYFSLAARLFAAAMATGSFFWFYQTQNARSYTLSLLIGVGILAISLSVLARRSRKDSRLPLRLAGLAVLMLVSTSLMIVPDVTTSHWPILLLLALFGASAIGWNGVYLAQVAQEVPKAEAATATAGCLFFTYLGVVFGPPVFGTIARLSDSLGLAYSLLAVPLVLIIILLARHLRAPAA